MTHTVERGERLYGIAKKYGTTVEAIATLNKLRNPNLILAGQTLQIPVITKPQTEIYLVRQLSYSGRGAAQFTGEDVRAVQAALTVEGFSPGRIDSSYGPKTKAAVIAYQRARGLKVDGVVGPQTWGALFDKAAPLEVPLAENIRRHLDIVKGCVTGKYVFGGQGHKLTTAWLRARRERYPSYFSGGRYEYLLAIAERCERTGIWNYPQDYAWDCSGLWWFAENVLAKEGLDLIKGRADATAHTLFTKYCDPITKTQLCPGAVVGQKDSAGTIVHMGIVGEEGEVYEAMSGYTGVIVLPNVNVRTAARIVGSGTHRRSAWDTFAMPKCFA